MNFHHTAIQWTNESAKNFLLSVCFIIMENLVSMQCGSINKYSKYFPQCDQNYFCCKREIYVLLAAGNSFNHLWKSNILLIDENIGQQKRVDKIIIAFLWLCQN